MDILDSLKNLLVILMVAAGVFFVTKPVCLRFMTADNFQRRRNVWFALTVVAFVSPSFWLYALFAIPLVAWAGGKENNPVALYTLLLFVIPPFKLEIPTVLVGSIFELSNQRILSIGVLLPAAWKILHRKNKNSVGQYGFVDLMMVAYAALLLAVYIPYESPTNTVRRAVVYFLDIGVLYYVVSRLCSNRRILVETLAAFALACALFAPMAVVESLKSWLLYADLANTWGVYFPDAYLFRGDALRAQVSTGHSLALGSLMALGFGFWLYLRQGIKSKKKEFAIGAFWMWAGLLAAYSRGPWIFAAVVYFVHLGLGKDGFNKMLKAAVVATFGMGVAVISPIGERIIDSLPFIGTIDSDNVVYRQQVAEKSWELIKQNPLFGDPLFISKMEDLRQGQGIIDIVNAYAVISLSVGLVGLVIFLLPILRSLWQARGLIRKALPRDPDLASLGQALIACVLGNLVMLGTAGITEGFYLLISLLVAFTQIRVAEGTRC